MVYGEAMSYFSMHIDKEHYEAVIAGLFDGRRPKQGTMFWEEGSGDRYVVVVHEGIDPDHDELLELAEAGLIFYGDETCDDHECITFASIDGKFAYCKASSEFVPVAEVCPTGVCTTGVSEGAKLWRLYYKIRRKWGLE